MYNVSVDGFGCIDGKALVEMNNLAVGYFPSESPEIGVYPLPSAPEPPPLEQQIPLMAE